MEQQTSSTNQTELTNKQYEVLYCAANDEIPIRAIGTEDGIALDIVGEKILLPDPVRTIYYDMDYQTATYELGPFEVEMELDNGDPNWIVSRRAVADGGVDAYEDQRPSRYVEKLMRLQKGDQIRFKTEQRRTSYRAEVVRVDQKIVEGKSDDPREEVINVYIDLEWSDCQFDVTNLILHAARPINGNWPNDEPIVIDDLMCIEDAKQLDYLYRTERASGVNPQITSPRYVAETWGIDRRIDNEIVNRAINRVEEQWTNHRRPVATALIEAGFQTDNIDVRIDGSSEDWKLSVTHAGDLDSLSPDSIDVEAAARDFCSDVLAEICELMRERMNFDRHRSVKSGETQR